MAHQTDKRIMRITWNSNNWEFPCGHPWIEKNQGKRNIAFENKHGFGHEEWLFNERYRIEGYQYGFIRGVENLSKNKEIIDQIMLYTIKPNKRRCIVGGINNVEVIEGFDEELQKVKPLFKKYFHSMREELAKVNANVKYLDQNRILPNVKFKWSETELFQQPIPVDFLNGASFNRFQAYRVNDNIINQVNEVFEQKNKFFFQPGKAHNSYEHTRITDKKETNVKRRHGEITNDLYDYLISNGINVNNISVEKTRIEGAIVDLVVRKNESNFELYEVKTNNSALKNIRQALGQILEYALSDASISCNKLIIVGPAQFRENEKEYFERLKQTIAINLEYWAYDQNVISKFIKLN